MGTAVASGAREGRCRIGRGHERGLEGVVMGCGAKVGPGAEARDSLLEHNVNRGGDAACGGVVDPITKGLRRIAHEHTTERFRIQFATLVVRGFGKGSASEHTECCCVWCGTCKKGEGNAPSRTNGSAECAIAEEHGGAHSTWPHGGGDKHGVHHGKRTVAERAPWPFRRTEHVMCAGAESCVPTPNWVPIAC